MRMQKYRKRVVQGDGSYKDYKIKDSTGELEED